MGNRGLSKIVTFFSLSLWGRVGVGALQQTPAFARSKNPHPATYMSRLVPEGEGILTAGFTLIELSIVLVIIGLIVGGVLTGRDLIAAAEIRAQISQIEKYNTAVRTFQLKYDGLPGDLANAANFGFVARGAYRGQGDGNGILEGNYNNTAGGYAPQGASNGESVLFWRDLSQAGLIGDSFTVATNSTAGNITTGTTPNINAFLPIAKAGGGNIYIWSLNGINYYGITNLSILGFGMQSAPAMKVQTAYSIDSKIDDGLPQSGNVLALYYTNVAVTGLWWAGGTENATLPYTPYTTATPASATTCFDNGNVAGTQKYSTGTNGGNGANCALSFKFQ